MIWGSNAAHGFGCGGVRTHTAASSAGYCCQPYKLFSAAYDGCRECVRASIEDELVDPRVESPQGTNALDWALQGAASDRETNWVQGYLEARGVRRCGAGRLDRPRAPKK